MDRMWYTCYNYDYYILAEYTLGNRQKGNLFLNVRPVRGTKGAGRPVGNKRSIDRK